MDAVIQVETSNSLIRASHSYLDVVVRGETTTLVSTWVTVLFDQLMLIKQSLWANAPNEPHINYIL